MGKKWRLYLGCVLKPKPNENKKKKRTQKSQGLFSKQKNEGLDVSEEVVIAALNPGPPSPKPDVVLIDQAIDIYSVIEDEHENAINARSASTTLEDDVAKDGDSVIEVENVDERDEHLASKGEKDDHTTEGLYVTEAKNEVTYIHKYDVKDADDQVTDGYSVIHLENMDAINVHSSAKEADDHAMDEYSVIQAENVDAMNAPSLAKDANDQAMDGYFVIEAENEDATNPHYVAKDVDGDQVKGGYSVIEVENEDASDPHSAPKDVDDDQINSGYSVIEVENNDARNPHSAAKYVEDDQVKGKYSVIEVENDDARNPHFAAKDVDDQIKGGYSVIEVENYVARNPNSSAKYVENYQTLDRHFVYEAENEESRNAHSTAKDAKDLATYEHSVTEVDNGDGGDAHSIVRDIEDDHAMGRDSVVEAENENARNAYFDMKDAEDDEETEYSMIHQENEHSTGKNVVDGHATDRYSVIEAKNENARNALSDMKDVDDQTMKGYSVAKIENGKTRNLHSVAKGIEDDQKMDIFYLIEKDNMDARKSHSATKVVEDGQARHAHSIALISTTAAEGVAIPSHAAAKVKSKKEVATLKIQSAFRGYLARRSFQDVKGIKGLMRLQTLVQAQFVRRQATTTLKCMQTMARVQHQVRDRRIRMYEENQALQRQLQQKHDLNKSKSNMKEDWIDSPQSKEQIEANRQREQQAAIRRERELAYAYTHQLTWKSSPKQATQAFMELDNPQWDWNWLEKRMGERPWDNRTITEELNIELPSAKSVTTLSQKARHDLNLDHIKPSPTPKNKTRTPRELSVSSPRTTPKSLSADRARVPNSPLRSVHSMDGDYAKSMQSMRSERQRRHSGTGSSTRDDESQSSPRFMSPTTSAKAKSRLRMEKNGSPVDSGSSTKNKFLFAGSHSTDSAPTKTRKAH